MAVNRIWFPNEPTGSIDVLQRSQIGIGYPFPFVPPVDLTIVYMRRYLNDPETVVVTGPAVSLPAGTETSLTSYMRRYLNDPTS